MLNFLLLSLQYRFGPLNRIWCMRFEAKHKEFKQVCHRTSFKNIFKTLVEHHQMRLAFNLSSDLFIQVHIDASAGKALLYIDSI